VIRISTVKANVLALILTVVGCAQVVGYLLHSRVLRGLGAALVVAPFPKVFSDVDGLETFASEFLIRGTDAAGNTFEIQITPELYQQLGGSYNRRNVYGAALSYAPRLPEELWQTVFCYGVATDGPLRREFGFPEGAENIEVVIRTRTRGRDDQWVLTPDCAGIQKQ
jgi:hypothetical protein